MHKGQIVVENPLFVHVLVLFVKATINNPDNFGYNISLQSFNNR